MGTGGSRTYVVRVWIAPGGDAHGGRATVEEVHSGRQGELRGEAAAALAGELDRAVAPEAIGSRPRDAGPGRTEEGVPQEGAVR
jgi:hypothetical protein